MTPLPAWAPIMPAEIRATVQLYLDGKIRECYSREDSRGGVFLVNTSDVAEARAIMESLPLAKESPWHEMSNGLLSLEHIVSLEDIRGK
jgi:hypothetical protein